MKRNYIGILIISIIVLLIGVGVFSKFRGENKTGPSQQVSQPVTIENEITLTSSGFEPATVTVNKDDRVIWYNKSNAEASVNSADHPSHQTYRPLNLGTFANASSVQLQFDTPGTYEYHNHLNPTQRGTVVVQ